MAPPLLRGAPTYGTPPPHRFRGGALDILHKCRTPSPARDRLERDPELARVPERARRILGECQDLVAFLATGPQIGASAAVFL
jgi:hypothetical protein